MGRRKPAALRALAEQHGWLKPDVPLPEDKRRRPSPALKRTAR
jgi:hypothetical protein